MDADIKAKYASLFGMDRPTTVKGCDHPGCADAGLYKAPKSRATLYDYYWFCLDHVRAYNQAWDFYAGMNTSEIEQAIKFDTVWQRETWPMGGNWQQREEEMRHKMRAEFFGDGMHARAPYEAPPPSATRPPPHIIEALAVLELEADASVEEMKTQYKKLVKRHHPDANGGSRAAEDKIKIINQAFTALKTHFAMVGEQG
ncbi:MAG: J domain-containing protein [Alphaproteobacteria bacterium]|nr:J domain-containing protein [Alphaproteobacteria bacterium]